MEMMNRAIEDAADFRGMMDKIEGLAAQQRDFARKLLDGADRGDSVQGNPPPLGMERQPGENRAAHRARLKAERRARKVPA